MPRPHPIGCGRGIRRSAAERDDRAGRLDREAFWHRSVGDRTPLPHRHTPAEP